VTIKQTWAASFSLVVNESIESTLNFSLFADGSYIEFVNREGENITEPLPETQITIVPGLTPEMLLNASMHITGFNLTDRDAQAAHFCWNVSYDGEFPLTAELALKHTDDEDDYWHVADAVTMTPETTSGTGTAFIGECLPGTYIARIRVSSEDAGYDTQTLPFEIDSEHQFFIKLE
jgi:hypothetical protein